MKAYVRSAPIFVTLLLAAGPAAAAWSLTGNPLSNVAGDVAGVAATRGFDPVIFAGPAGYLTLFWIEDGGAASDIFSGGLSDFPPPDPAPGTEGQSVVSGPGFRLPGGEARVRSVQTVCSQFGCPPSRVFVWTEFPPSGGSQVRAIRRVDSIDWGPAGMLVATSPDPQEFPSVVSDGDQGVIVVWRNEGGLKRTVRAQHLDGGGTRLWGAAGIVIGPDTTDHGVPQILADGSGGAYVLRSDRRDGFPNLVLFRITNAGTTAPGWPADGVVVGTHAAGNPPPLLRATGGPGVWIVWSEVATLSNDGVAFKPRATLITDAGVAAAGYSTAGTAVAPAFDGDVNATDAAVTGSDLVIVYDCTREVPGPSPSGTDVRARRLRDSGAPVPGWPDSGLVICDQPGTQDEARVVPGPIVAWTDRRSGGADIYAQRLLADGSRPAEWPANGLAVCTVTGDQRAPVMANNAVGGALIAWLDERDLATTGVDLYGQTVTGDARLDAPQRVGRSLALDTPRPNPAREQVRFRIHVPAPTDGRLEVLDVLGRIVADEPLVLSGGDQEIAWGLTDTRGVRVRPGVYLVRVHAGATSGARRMVVTR